jgi:hypothetical protein
MRHVVGPLPFQSPASGAPQDLVVLLRLALPFEPVPSFAALGAELGITASEAHAALRQFLQHGARYCFPASQGGMTRGIPTWYAASPPQGADTAGQRSAAGLAVEERHDPWPRLLPALPECP